MTTIAKAKQFLLGEQEPEWIVWALVAVMLLAGFLTMGSVQGQTEAFSGSGVTLTYPGAWAGRTPEEAGLLFKAGDRFSTAGFATGIEVWQVAKTDVGRNLEALEDIAFAWTNQRAAGFESFTALTTTPMKVDGKDAMAVEYAYVAAPDTSASLPVVVHAVDVLVPTGDNLTIISFAAESHEFEAAAGTWQAILKSTKIQ
jgi:hypothetical protein